MTNIQLLNRVSTITESYRKVAKATGGNFNLFSILRIESKEVNTHSAFIAELLNPQGNHGQSDVFLKIFLNCLSIEDFDTEGVKIFKEYYVGRINKEYTEGGNIDILIKKTDDDVILIENKIYADEQKNQLLRYSNAFTGNKRIYYLTLFGERSKEKSSEDVEYESISYSEKIVEWLELCKIEVIDIPILREAISQYLILVKRLTHQNSNKKMSKDIANKVLQDEESFDSYINILQSQSEIYKEVIRNTVLPLLDRIAKAKELDLDIDRDSIINKPSGWIFFSFANKELKDNNLSISFMSNSGSKSFNEFIYGFSYNDKKEGIADDKKLQTLFTAKNENMHVTVDWPCWSYYDNFRNWEDLHVLKAIQFGDFEKDIEEKIDRLLMIFSSYLNEAE